MMNNKATVHYVTGGERSGKSRFAQQLAETLSPTPYYLATARIWDQDFQKRVDRHLTERDERWTTIEEEKHLGALSFTGKVVVMDCVTLWLTNWFSDTEGAVDLCLDACKKELNLMFAQEATFIIISNEIGMGVHAETHVGRKFTELQGWMNQCIAQQANHATMMVSGLPLTLK